MVMSVYLEFLRVLESAIARAGNANRLAEVINVHPNLITRWRKKERVPNLDSIQPVLDYMGVRWGVDEPVSLKPCSEALKEVAVLRAQVEQLTQERDKAVNAVEMILKTLEARGQESAPAPAKKVALPPSSGSRTG